tara:strand:+ start:17186 stop:18340 length:1155 start_codon:yes stop_codon:yes gene_type:complete
VKNVEEEIRALIQQNGPITFSQFMQICLYSPKGGFYSTRANRINTEFGTSPTSHPVFGTLIAKQLNQMWEILDSPSTFQVIEVGSGDGALARSIVDEIQLLDSGLSDALQYVATDYEPWWPNSLEESLGWDGKAQNSRPNKREITWGINRVKAEGVTPFKNITGCILCNELVDNFPFHQFVIQDGLVKEIYVTNSDKGFTEILDIPSSPLISNRLTSLNLDLPEGYRGEINLGIDSWMAEVFETLDRGFTLSIDYGELSKDLYSSKYSSGTLMCYNQHQYTNNPYQNIGSQDITSFVDFTSLMKAGEKQGFTTQGYTLQRRFLENLGFYSYLDSLDTKELSYARKELSRIAMKTLIDPDDYGDFKVLIQSKGIIKDIKLLGFKN